MAQPQFNIGRDATLNIVVNGIALKPKLLKSFTYAQDVEEVTSKPLNRRPIHRNIPIGWHGDAAWDRADSDVDDYFSQAEDAFWASGAPSDDVFILHTVRDPNTGTLSQYRFEGVVLKLEDGGRYEMDKTVEVKVAFKASARRKVL